jgi:hypothetical protein
MIRPNASQKDKWFKELILSTYRYVLGICRENWKQCKQHQSAIYYNEVQTYSCEPVHTTFFRPSTSLEVLI